MDKVIDARQLDYKTGNALITSASAKIPLIDAFKKAINKINPKNKVIAADTSALALSQYVADQFWEMPITDTSSVDKILKFCLDNEVKCILPTRDGELAFWANKKEYLTSCLYGEKPPLSSYGVLKHRVYCFSGISWQLNPSAIPL